MLRVLQGRSLRAKRTSRTHDEFCSIPSQRLLVRGVQNVTMVIGSLGLVATGGAGCSRAHHPTDAELLSCYAAHRPAFERLRDMITADSASVRSIDESTVVPNVDGVVVRGGVARKVVSGETVPMPLSPARLGDYRTLMREVELIGRPDGKPGGELGVSQGERLVVAFTYSRRQLLDALNSKGIVFMSQPPSALQAGLDDARNVNVTEDGCAYRAIEPGWYIRVCKS